MVLENSVTSVYIIKYYDRDSFEDFIEQKFFRSYRAASEYLLFKGGKPSPAGGKSLYWDVDEEYIARIVELEEGNAND